jgi:hypothetical protein
VNQHMDIVKKALDKERLQATDRATQPERKPRSAERSEIRMKEQCHREGSSKWEPGHHESLVWEAAIDGPQRFANEARADAHVILQPPVRAGVKRAKTDIGAAGAAR